jgi:pimeloyl-ACP methyl ester carboxylesterase
MPPRSQHLTFPGAHSDLLSARLELPPAHEPRAYAVFAHCFTCGKDIRAAATISRTLAQEGIAVMRFDFTGLGSSQGDFANTTFSSNITDLIAGAHHLDAERAPAHLLVGHSIGGAAVLAAVAHLPAVRAVATIGAPFEARDVRRLLAGDLETIERDGEAVVSIAGRPFRIKREFLDDLRHSRSRDAIANLGRPLLILHSPVDTVVPVDNARRIFAAARHPKSFVALDGADHLLSSMPDADYVARILSAWASRYL